MTYTGEVEVGGPADVQSAGDLRITKLAVGEMSNNAYLLRCELTGEQVLVDAAAEPDRLLELVGDAGLARIVTTHRHHDHWGALAAVKDATGAETVAGERDAEGIDVASDRRDALIGELDVVVVEEADADRVHRDRIIADIGDADTAADREADAVVAAEVEHRVEHAGEDFGLTADRRIYAELRLRQVVGDADQRSVDLVEVKLLERTLDLEAGRACVITEHEAGFPAGLGVGDDCLPRRADIVVEIFGKHDTGFGAEVELAITCHGRRGQHGGNGCSGGKAECYFLH